MVLPVVRPSGILQRLSSMSRFCSGRRVFLTYKSQRPVDQVVDPASHLCHNHFARRRRPEIIQSDDIAASFACGSSWEPDAQELKSSPPSHKTRRGYAPDLLKQQYDVQVAALPAGVRYLRRK